MLSVQSPGCAGMERLGVPARSSFGSSAVHDNMSHISCRLRTDATVLESCDISTAAKTRNANNNYRSNHHHNYHCNNINVNNTKNLSDMRSCPHHILLSDGEWGPDRNVQIRPQYQQTEITRSYIKPPPNKTAFDIPEHSYNFYTSPVSSLSSASSLSSSSSACNNYSSRSITPSSFGSSMGSTALLSSTSTSSSFSAAQHSQQHQQEQKSKHNALTKFFLRISNSKSPETTSTITVTSNTGPPISQQQTAVVLPIQSSKMGNNFSISSGAGSNISSAITASLSVSASIPSSSSSPLTSNNLHQLHYHHPHLKSKRSSSDTNLNLNQQNDSS